MVWGYKHKMKSTCMRLPRPLRLSARPQPRRHRGEPSRASSPDRQSATSTLLHAVRPTALPSDTELHRRDEEHLAGLVYRWLWLFPRPPVNSEIGNAWPEDAQGASGSRCYPPHTASGRYTPAPSSAPREPRSPSAPHSRRRLLCSAPAKRKGTRPLNMPSELIHRYFTNK